MAAWVEIEIGGKVRKAFYGQSTHAEIVTKSAGMTNQVLLGCVVIWAGLHIATVINGEVSDFTFGDVCQWCENEQISIEDVAKVTDAYKESVKFLYNTPKKKQPVRKKK